MKTVILCGGLGSRLADEANTCPKPMVTIGPHPMLWHIMRIFSYYNYNQFVLALGYKGEVIKEYFLNYHALRSDFSVDLSNGEIYFEKKPAENWKVQLVDTGENTMTGGRLLRLKNLLSPQGTFMLTYGDGVANINLEQLVRFHRSHGKLVTVTAVRPSPRFGGIVLEENRVAQFYEKSGLNEGWINGGFFVMEPGVFNYLKDDSCILEREPLEKLAQDGELMAYQHFDFWQCMDTVRDKQFLEELWEKGDAPWYFNIEHKYK